MPTIEETRATLAYRLAQLEGDEVILLGELMRRIEKGRLEYGQWKAATARDYDREVREELLDAVIYRAMRAVFFMGIPKHEAE